MSLRLYNSLTKHEEDFVPHKKKAVTMYTCGPTVYGRPHIGNYSSFLMADLLRRWLEASGFAVTHVKNFTDVGHLVADQDEGEDKIEKQALEEKNAKQNPTSSGAAVPGRGDSTIPSSRGALTKDDIFAIVEKYTNQYLEDEASLNMLEPEHRPRATQYVAQMIEMIQKLVDKNHAYETDDGVYFSVESFPAYGKLSGNTLDKLHAGSRVNIDEEKKHPADFALWKKCVGENEHHILRWESPWGEGFPGWHIECSAMSLALLGKEIDIHTGGEDNIFPHHECEIAQSECAVGSHPFVRVWLHKRRIDLAGDKMSKSLGNVLTIPSIMEKGYSPLDLRYYLLSVHYRTNLKFTWKGMDDARIARRKIMEWMEHVSTDAVSTVPDPKGETDPEIEKALTGFTENMNADLNTSGALASVFTLMNHEYAARKKKKQMTIEDARKLTNFINTVRRTFGCFEPEEIIIPNDVQLLVKKRGIARAEKNFAESDRLRDEIASLGYEVRDSGGEQSVRKV